jgi:glycosyltransferase involved in cell wall biosynthesis
VAITHGQVLIEALEQECIWLNGRTWSIPHGPLGLLSSTINFSPIQPSRLLFFGRIQKYKGLEFFVAAVTKLHREGLPVVGVIAGFGDDLECCRDAIADAGCFEIWDHYIPSDKVPELFQNARAVVLPYVEGTQSGVAALALGYARPVVASAVGSIPELVRHGQNGLLVPPSDAVVLADALRAVVTDDFLWTQLSHGAVTLRDGELSWKTISARTQEAYRATITNETQQRPN